MIEITFTEEGLWEAAVYFIGLYSQLTEKKIALIDVQPNEIETYQDTIINPPNIMQDMKFKVPKQTFSDKMQLKFDLLEKFIFHQCVLDEEHKILASPLLLAFSHHINSIIEPTHEFPFLMKLFTSKYPQFNITKTSTSKGIMYKRVTLINYLVNQKKINKQSKSKKITNNNPKPINFESNDFQSNSNQSSQLINFHPLPIKNQLNITQPITLLQSFEITSPTKIIPTQSKLVLLLIFSQPINISSSLINLPIQNTVKSPILPTQNIVKPSILPSVVIFKFKSVV